MIHNSKPELSVALATYNEERILTECLSSIKSIADEIVVVDGSSQDKTVEIARSFGAKVIVEDNKPIFHINKQIAIDECRGDWILQLDADEIVTPELAREIEKIVKASDNRSLMADNQPVAFYIKRKKMFLGRFIKKGGQYPDPVIRLFKKGKAFLPCKSVHEQMQVNGETGWLKEPMLHLPTPSFSVYITKDNRYSTLTANEFYDKNLALNAQSFLTYVFVKPFLTFFSLFIRHRGFEDGFPGFVFALFSGLHYVSAYVKYWEMKNTKNKDIEKDWK
ncbi:glycosyltransferase family 2 protein [Candidatus Microgenomates bacterium]|jgi:glycosyltransferase involved in cell wall biosynthesis|nr:MAG: glycosyltransferase family 2 protein [Candidatus Microgenomates bacterium]